MDKKKGYQNLTEEEEKIWIPNRNLQLTQKAEIVRLNKVIEEKTPQFPNSRNTTRNDLSIAIVLNRTTP